MNPLADIATIAHYALLESLRRRTLTVLGTLSTLLVALYVWGLYELRDVTDGLDRLRSAGVDPEEFIGAQMAGIGLFGVMFTAAVLAVLLLAGGIRGDAELGILQPMVARPIGRTELLLVRHLVVTAVTALYATAGWLAVALSTHAVLGWSPNHWILPAVLASLAVAAIAAATTSLSVILPAATNSIASFLYFGGGIAAGMVTLIPGTSSARIERAVLVAAPFERTYKAAVGAMTPPTSGGAGPLAAADWQSLGPFAGGIPLTPAIVAWTACFTALVLTVGVISFNRRDV